MDKDDINKLLKKYNLSPNFTYGQNFLIDENVLDEIVETANLTSSDQVLEIGPGIGNLTEKLLKAGAEVFAVEKDPKFLPILRSIKHNYPDAFKYQILDFLKMDLSRVFTESIVNSQESIVKKTNDYSLMTNDYKVVANIPYFITGKILQMLLTGKYKPKSITILTQKEVAKNIVAKKGSLSIPAIAVQIFGLPKIIKIVKASSFYPAPKVDSSILHIEVFQEQKYKIEDEKKFFRVVKACFLGKRKQIHNTLVNNLGLEKRKVQEILGKLKIKLNSRPQELSIEEWVSLVNEIKNDK